MMAMDVWSELPQMMPGYLALGASQNWRVSKLISFE